MNQVEAQLAEIAPDIFADQPPAAASKEHATSDVIPEGKRNQYLAQRGGQMRRIGLGTDEIAAALSVLNHKCDPPLSDFEVRTIARSISRYTPGKTDETIALVGFTVEQLAGHVFPERPALLERDGTVVFRAGHLGQVYAERGIGKTWFLQTMALIAATGKAALGFRAPRPCRVLEVDGEMAGEELQERDAVIRDRLELPLTNNLTYVGADWQEQYLPRVDTVEGQAALEPFVAAADLIILDNRSCLFDSEGEKDAAAWQPAQDYLLALKRRGKGVIVAHHSNRQGGARGHSKPEDSMNVLIRLSRHEDYSQDQGARFLVTFDKCRGAYGPAVAPFSAHLTAEGWLTESAAKDAKDTTSAKLLEYVRLAHQAGDRPKSANAAITGAKVGRNAGLASWATLVKDGEIQKHHEGGFFAL